MKETALSERLGQQLQQILDALNLTLSTTDCDKIVRYLELLFEWNQRFNLTAIRDPEQMMIRHIADSLVVAQFLSAERILDVGTGAGLPGIPLSLVLPNTKWTLLDSNGKKISFLKHVKAELELENITIVQTRVEQYIPELCYDGIITRAWTSLEQMIKMLKHLSCPQAKLWALKGKFPVEELKDVKKSYEVIPLTVPMLQEQRHLVVVSL